MQYTYLHEGNTYKLIFFKGPQKASPPTRNIIYNPSAAGLLQLLFICTNFNPCVKRKVG